MRLRARAPACAADPDRAATGACAARRRGRASSGGPDRLVPRSIDDHRVKGQPTLAVRAADEMDRVEGNIVGPVGDRHLTPATRTERLAKLRHRVSIALAALSVVPSLCRGPSLVQVFVWNLYVYGWPSSSSPKRLLYDAQT
jgi:hypothetical protein